MGTKLYMGLDLSDSLAQVSFWQEGEKEPVTVSTRKGEEQYQIPTSLYVGKGGYYLYGAEAEKKRNVRSADLYEQLYLRAVDMADSDGAGEAVGRLGVFVRRLIRLKENLYPKDREFDIYLAITVPELSVRGVKALELLAEELKPDIASICWMDYGESFFYYTFYQDRSVWAHDIALFDFSDRQVRFTLLVRETRTEPQIVLSGQETWQVSDEIWENDSEKDRFFADILREAFAKRIVSGVFLTGDGFDGDWMKEVFRVLGPNRRVFVGKNLYTKGAAYAALTLDRKADWPYLYEGSYKVQSDVRLEVTAGGQKEKLPLARAGQNWFDEAYQYTAILRGTPVVRLLVTKGGERKPKVCDLELEDIWKRPEQTRRISISGKMTDVRSLHITVKDTGFGSFYPPEPKSWEFDIQI
ncbi:MAG TPA: hypothetical protein IAA08_09365 [Candidatus Eubacterium avistercoris]|uniref:DUF5716 domain-containing protein n=1 Tax=Candidatus Eubacterium avistercoris TaxID=2838567 RepID=A0A9D2D486_9FIRM|nr:hypothetical protein [Candidatus Eubacterium avistercoris]